MFGRGLRACVCAVVHVCAALQLYLASSLSPSPIHHRTSLVTSVREPRGAAGRFHTIDPIL